VLYSTKNVDAGKFLRRFYENLNFMTNDDATHGDQFQERLERTCTDELKKIFLSRGRNSWRKIIVLASCGRKKERSKICD
jgi:hypothetical protein